MLTALRSSRRLALVPAVIVCFTLALLALPAKSRGQTRCGNEFDYYSDDTYSCQVGMRYWGCNCEYASWGRTSGYVIIQDLGCS
jgi:hypothetical protein